MQAKKLPLCKQKVRKQAVEQENEYCCIRKRDSKLAVNSPEFIASARPARL